MIYLRPIQYANSLLSKYPYMNIGGDSKLILSSYIELNSSIISRPLISPPHFQLFPASKIQAWIYPNYADLNVTSQKEISIYAMSKQWTPGAGIFSKNNINTGDGSNWITCNGINRWQKAGGDYYTNKFYTITKSYSTIYDIYIFDVTQLQTNIGYIIKFYNETSNFGIIEFYSPNTDTCFYPKYVYYVDDFIYTSPKYQIKQPEDFVVKILNLEKRYEKEQKVILKIKFIPKQYSRDWTSSVWSSERNNWCLSNRCPAYYEIYDVTDIQAIKVYGYSQYTRINCDGKNNYFTLDIESLPRNKFYSINIKINNRIYSDLGVFKVV